MRESTTLCNSVMVEHVWLNIRVDCCTTISGDHLVGTAFGMKIVSATDGDERWRARRYIRHTQNRAARAIFSSLFTLRSLCLTMYRWERCREDQHCSTNHRSISWCAFRCDEAPFENVIVGIWECGCISAFIHFLVWLRWETSEARFVRICPVPIAPNVLIIQFNAFTLWLYIVFGDGTCTKENKWRHEMLNIFTDKIFSIKTLNILCVHLVNSLR